TLTQRDILIVQPETGKITGVVSLPNGQPAPQALVNAAGHAVNAGSDGSFTITGVPIGQGITVLAATRDETRSGYGTATLAQGGATATVNIVLSGLGQAVFTVIDNAGHPLPNVQVRRLDCNDVCGCYGQNTDAQGRVTFDRVHLGRLGA